MVDAEFNKADSPDGLASLRQAFERALCPYPVNGNESSTIVFSPVLSTLLADLTPIFNDAPPSEGYRETALSTGREFARIGGKANLRLEQLHHLGCRYRDLSKQFLAERVGTGKTEAATALTVYFDEFLLGVATESVYLETTAFHKKLREANRFILQERRRYYTIFKRMEEPAFIIDRDLHLLETNRAFDQFFKIVGKDHVGRNCYEVLGDDFRAACVLQDFLHAQGRGSGIEVDLVIHDEFRSIIVNGTFLGDINHESAGGIVILQDITHRRAAERALRDSERQYRSLIENVPDVTWRLNQEGEFAFVSPNAEKIYGYTAAEMMKSGANRCFRIHPDDLYLVRSEFTLFFATHLPSDKDLRRMLGQLPSDLPPGEVYGARNYDVKYRFQKKDGTWVWLHDRASRIDNQGGEWYADGVTSDITALKLAEAELERHHFRLAELVDERTVELQAANQLLQQEITVRRQTEQALMDLTSRLSASNQELDQFAHVASHDLKEPLMLIMAFSERLVKRYSASLDDKGMEYLRRITAAAEHMRQLIEGFLALSQVNSSVQTYEEIDLADLIQEVLQSLEERIKESHARIEIGKLGRLGGDRVQIRQLFQNIISNALKYRKPEGQPRVVLQGEMIDDTFYEILVQDNGIGFDPQDAERIFKPLERLHSRREFEGTGMGLTTCQKIVARHGGEILARGLPGEGATFIIRLPVALVR